MEVLSDFELQILDELFKSQGVHGGFTSRVFDKHDYSPYVERRRAVKRLVEAGLAKFNANDKYAYFNVEGDYKLLKESLNKVKLDISNNDDYVQKLEYAGMV